MWGLQSVTEVASLRPLPREFYARPAFRVARALLGRVLVHDGPQGRVAGCIVEVEAYRGAGDPASHAFRGPTPRNRVMFGEPGHAYVYFTYGMHHCLNVVCEPAGQAAAVLIRAFEPLVGVGSMRARRGVEESVRLGRGPGCVAQALGLDRSHDGLDLSAGPLFIAEAPRESASHRIVAGPRIGIRVGLERDWRFWLAGHPCVSASRATLKPALAAPGTSRAR